MGQIFLTLGGIVFHASIAPNNTKDKEPTDKLSSMILNNWYTFYYFSYSPDGFCLVGGGKQLALLSSDPKFPIAPRPFSIAKLTIVLNMTSRMPVDHRVVPWEPANEDIMTGTDF